MSFPYKDNTNDHGETLCSSCRFRDFKYYCIHDGMYHYKVGVCKYYQGVKHEDPNK